MDLPVLDTMPAVPELGEDPGTNGPALAVIIPTKGRPQNIVRAIDAWHATGAFLDAIMVLVVEGAERSIYLDALSSNAERWKVTNQGSGNGYDAPAGQHVYILETGAPGYGPGANWAARVIAADPQTETYLPAFESIRHIGVQGDDHVPETEGWAFTYVQHLDALVADKGAGMVYGDDGLRGEKLCTEWAVSVSWVRTLGRIIPSLCHHLFTDNSVLDLARAAQICQYLPGAKIRHHHPLAGLAETDDQYQRVNGSAMYDADRRTYVRWSTRPGTSDKAGLVSQAEKLMALRP